MRLTKTQQNALILTLYVSRSGRVKLASVAEELGLPLAFMRLIARKLRIAGVLRSLRGPGGGYSVIGDPTVLQVLGAVGFIGPDKGVFLPKNAELRALKQYTHSLYGAMLPVLKRKVRALNMELAANEAAVLDRIAVDSSVN